MPKRKVTEIVEELVTPITDEFGLELVDVEYKKEGGNWFLRVFIDRPEGGVDIEDCGRVSERLSDKLDEVDPIPTSYYLEVSSPGAERPLKKRLDYQRAVGKSIYISTYEPIEGSKTFEGILAAVDEEEIRITFANKEVTIPFEKIASAHLLIEF